MSNSSLKRLILEHFTVFKSVELEFSAGLNVIIGENGTGKSQILKLAYVVGAVSADFKLFSRQTRDDFQRLIAEKLISTCRPESLGRLVSRQRGRNRAAIGVSFTKNELNYAFTFSTNSKTEVRLDNELPKSYLESKPIFIPTREMLSLFPGFAALYEQRETQFDDTYYDLVKALALPPRKGKRPKEIESSLKVLEGAMGGSITTENGRFYLNDQRGNMEMPLVAEGIRKLAMLAYLIINGSLREGVTTLFWDEPETNLNPKLLQELAKLLVELTNSGIQIVLATHSLFLLRELNIETQRSKQKYAPRFFALGRTESGVEIQVGGTPDEIEPIPMLDADLEQTDRYMELA